MVLGAGFAPGPFSFRRERVMLMFCYGTLMNGFGNNYIFKGDPSRGEKPAKFIGPAIADELFQMRARGFPVVKWCGGDDGKDGFPVAGELWDIGESMSMLARLDRLEGYDPSAKHSGLYVRERCRVRLREGDYRAEADMYCATKRSWEYAKEWPKVEPDSNGLLNWSEHNKACKRNDFKAF